MWYKYKHHNMESVRIPQICSHVAVCLEKCIIVLGGEDEYHQALSLRNIWMYNLYTEEWRKHVIPGNKIVPAGTLYSCGVVIGADIYMFGGGGVWDHASGRRNCTNALWKLTRPSKQYFEWSEIVTQPQAKSPSPRYAHSGWEYAGKLWIFGGHGLPLAGYLNDHGDFKEDAMLWGNRNLYGKNNQLLCFNPSSGVWRNINTSGTIPRPCDSHATTIIGEKVWVHGGTDLDHTFKIHDLFQLDMIFLDLDEDQNRRATTTIPIVMFTECCYRTPACVTWWCSSKRICSKRYMDFWSFVTVLEAV